LRFTKGINKLFKFVVQQFENQKLQNSDQQIEIDKLKEILAQISTSYSKIKKDNNLQQKISIKKNIEKDFEELHEVGK
jgi:hypothetical protein